MLANKTYMGNRIEAGGVLKEAFGQVKALVLSETSLTIICPPCRPPRASWALFWQPRGSWLPSPWRSHVILGEWPGVTSCLLSAPAISDQMVTWENPACFADKSPSKLSWLHCCWWQCSQWRRSTPTTYPTILLCLCLRTGFHLPWASREGVLGGLLC